MCILTPLQIDGRELDSIVTNIKSFVRQSTTYQLFSFTSVFHTQQAVAHVFPTRKPIQPYLSKAEIEFAKNKP